METQRTGHTSSQVRVTYPASTGALVAGHRALNDMTIRKLGEAISDGRTYEVTVGRPIVDDYDAEERGAVYIRQDAAVLLADIRQAENGEYVAVQPNGYPQGEPKFRYRLSHLCYVLEPGGNPIAAAQVINKALEE